MATHVPTVSVIIPNYNHGRFLPKCLAGLQRQTMADLEIVLTDDGSTDGSPDIIREHARQDPRIKANYFSTNLGVTKACEDIFQRATGKYLYCAAADDFVISKDFFQNAVTALEQDSRAAGYYGVVGLLSAETEKLVGGMGSAIAEGYNAPADCFRGFVKCNTIVPTSGLILRRELIERHGGYDLTLGPQCDLYLNTLVASIYGVIFAKNPVACQRVYVKRTNFGASGNLWEMTARFAELERRLRLLGISYPEMEADWRHWRAVWALDCVRKTGINADLLPGVPAY